MIKYKHNQQLEPFTIDAATTVGKVTLAVADLDMMVRFYEQTIGLTVLDRTSQSAELGVDESPLIRFEARANGRLYPRATGLFHLAILLPTRQDLGQWLKHFIGTQRRVIDGAGDHLVSEALYLSDPEGNGLEIYRDRPRSSWQYNGDRLKMATLALDLPALIADAWQAPFTGLPAGTTVGHVHLQVDHLPNVVWFYRDVLGFALMEEFSGAGFLGAGGYHHHIGVNTWRSKGANPPPKGSLGLLHYAIICPTDTMRNTLLTRLQRLNYPISYLDNTPLLHDPAGNAILLETKERPT